MNAASGADALPGTVTSVTVPEQTRCSDRPASSRGTARAPDPLDHADPRTAADAATVENLLRCWVRENDAAPPRGDILRLTLTASGIGLRVPVRYWSATGWHRFGHPVLEGGPADAPTVDAVTLAALLSREATYQPARDAEPLGGGGGEADCGRAAVAADEYEYGTAYSVEGARGSAYGGDGAPRGAYGGDGACGGAYGVAEALEGAYDAKESGQCGDAQAPAADAGLTATGMAYTAAVAAVDAMPTRSGSDPYGASGATGANSVSVSDASVAHQSGVAAASLDVERWQGAGGATAVSGAELVGRVADSVRRTAVFLADRRAAPTDSGTGGAFLAGEQALLLGHPLHPTSKSREGLSEAEAGTYSPELRGAFPLHWFAVDPSVLAADSAWTERGRTVPADRLITVVAGAPPLPSGAVPLPLHPWQAREVRHRTAVAALIEAGLVRDLGSSGAPWHATSSVRTVFRPAGPAMLKLSLGVRITNSRRENLRKELLRGVEVHRLLRSGLAKEWRAACPGQPGFDIVRDPAWLAVDGPDGEPVTGLDVVIRHNPFAADDDAVCLAGLVSPRPWPGRQGQVMCSRLAHIVSRLAARTGRPVGAVSAEWFLRYLHTVVRPLLWLDGAAGVALEAHQQNTVVLLDAYGWPTGGRYRDNQGFYFRESHRAALDRRLPGIGVRSDTFVSDEVTDERFAYYLGINNVLGLIGAFGAQRLSDERLLIAAFRRFLGEASRQPAATRSPLAARLLDAPTLRCKANMLTRLRGLDELAGPVDTQSVYVTVANPLVASAP
ncbi:IucA/IucC family protein [Streptomyces zagrosensis]|uniref:Siderophore synthetase component n=1 Tax=Streptomyces zagrosensis TaxID=1042984 RepID=A0A7W9V080_9ACTN|nr:IucA/IucC family protein [Streptomyces zagrosensis]MBB5937532.1 siderophore synthetase component [Streptomyces zagrosensis]